MYISFDDFEWDETKNHSNILKHGVSFENSAYSLQHDTSKIILEDTREYLGEIRLKIISLLLNKITITSIITQRNRKIRIILARKSSKKDTQLYYEKQTI